MSKERVLFSLNHFSPVKLIQYDVKEKKKNNIHRKLPFSVTYIYSKTNNIEERDIYPPFTPSFVCHIFMFCEWDEKNI